MWISRKTLERKLWLAEHRGYLQGLELRDKSQELADVMTQLSQPIGRTYLGMPEVYKDFKEYL